MRSFLLLLLRMVVLLPPMLLVLLIRLVKWLIAPPALLIQILIGTPLVLLRVRQPARPHFVSVTEAELPDATWIALTNGAEALAADGFTHRGDFRCDRVILNAVLWVRLLTQSEQGIAAIVVHIKPKTDKSLDQNYVEFSTDFDNGRVLNTNNLNLPYSLPAPAYMARLQLKDVWDPRALYVLHRQLVAALPQTVNQTRIKQAEHDPVTLLTDSYAREIQTLIQHDWFRLIAGKNQVRLSVWGALHGVWRQAWPLASLYLRAADRHSRQILAEHGIDATEFTGGAIAVVVDRQPIPAEAGVITTVQAGYGYVRSLAQHTDPGAVLESVVVELNRDAAGTVIPGEFRYSFRSCKQQSERRICRLNSFDILLDPDAEQLAVTAMEREAEQAGDEEAWQSILEEFSLQLALRPGPWLCDLDTLLPTALEALNARAGDQSIEPDSASLYTDEDGVLRWQVVAWAENETPLHVMINARTGAIIDS